MSNNHEKREDGEVKEEFCSACLTIPLALVGAAGAGYGLKKKGMHAKMKKFLLVGGLLLTFISVIATIYFLNTCKQCSA